MIISRTPFRISFFGGGTDYPAWYRNHGGVVLGTSIDKYCYLTCRYLPPFFSYRHRIVYSQVELANSVEEIQHPAVRGVLQEMNIQQGLEIHHDADLPARSGLGSSSTFTVGLIHALEALHGRMISKKDLAERAVYIEQEVLKETVGCQDQILAAFGGFNLIRFQPNDTYDIASIILQNDRLMELQSHLMLFFTGYTRFASEIAKTLIENFENRRRELQEMQAMTYQAMQILENSRTSLDEFGKLLHESWKLKRSISEKVSNPTLDEIYERAQAAGATGGKVLGAGGGGFMLFFVPLEYQAQVREALKELIHVPFQFDFSGSKIVVYEPNGFPTERKISFLPASR